MEQAEMELKKQGKNLFNLCSTPIPYLISGAEDHIGFYYSSKRTGNSVQKTVVLLGV